jgi:hypothetical protein
MNDKKEILKSTIVSQDWTQTVGVKGKSQELENFSSQEKIEAQNKKLKRIKKQSKSHIYFSIKYKIFLIIIWLIFFASFIVGFIVHYEVKSHVNASTIIWTFSSIIFCVSVIYSYLYYKANSNSSPENMRNYLKYFPL